MAVPNHCALGPNLSVDSDTLRQRAGHLYVESLLCHVVSVS